MNKLIVKNKLAHIFILERDNYLISTVAPASSNLALISLASASGTASLTIEGAASTKSLASFKPRPVTARTSLITLIFFSPNAVNITLNSVLASAVGAASPPPAAATATGAEAETPHFSSSNLAKSAASKTVN